MIYGLAWRESNTVQHSNFCSRHILNTGFIQDGRDAFHSICADFLLRQMHHRQQGMSFTATKRGLELDHRIPALTGQSAGYGDKQESHPFGDEGTGKKFLSI